MQKHAFLDHVQAVGDVISNDVLGDDGASVFTCAARMLQETCMVLLPLLCFTIGACVMGLLLHSSCETPFFTKTFVETFLSVPATGEVLLPRGTPAACRPHYIGLILGLIHLNVYLGEAWGRGGYFADGGHREAVAKQSSVMERGRG
jgi:hypothetical protein